MLKFCSVCAGYGRKKVLQNIDLTYHEGFHVILGSNGSGKTTLFRVGSGILPPFEGSVEVLGENPYQMPSIKRQVGYLSHGAGMSTYLTVLENLHFWARVQKMPRKQFESRLEEFIHSLSLSDILHEKISRLSRGQFQRAALAQTLLHDPKILFLDEPTTGLDPTTARSLRDLLRRISKGRTIIYSTHNLHEASDLANDITFLRKGRVIARGSLDELRNNQSAIRRFCLKVNRDPREVFRSFAVEAIQDQRGWFIECQSDEELGRIVEALIAHGMQVSEVRRLDDDLEQIFLQKEKEGYEY